MKYFIYIFWLLGQIIISTWQVTKLIWSPKLTISPQIGYIPLGLRSRLAQIIYTNSITLTPGTFSIQLTNDKILVHALTSAHYLDLESKQMEQKIKMLENN